MPTVSTSTSVTVQTAQVYITAALRKCGQMRPGYTPGPELLTDALNEWYFMFDSFNAKRTMAYTLPDYVFPVTGPGNGTTGNGQTFGGSGYQIGPTALDFVVPARPPAIVRANLYMTSVSPTTPARIPLSQISMTEWMNIVVVQLTPINVTTTFAYDPQFPNGVIWVWPPLNGNALEIFTWGALVPPVSLDDPYLAPPGYSDVVVYELAKRLFPMCTRDIMPERRSYQILAGEAYRAIQAVKQLNAPMPRIRNDFAAGHGAVPTNDLTQLLTGIPY